MAKKLFLLDGMALVYRAHFALVNRPIFTSKGVNTSALYGFTQTVLDILQKQSPTHLAVAFDTQAPTQRHAEFAEYKITRQPMPEDIIQALPHVRRMLEVLRIPMLTCDGFEADDIIGTLARRASAEGFQTFMVTPDKDFGQLVDERTFIYKPSRMGDGVEILGVAEIQRRWGIAQAEQVIDVLALMGDASDNIPGVPSIGEKTAMKLIGQYGTLENVMAHGSELTNRTRESLEANRDVALLSKRLATINCQVPCLFDLADLKVQALDETSLKALLAEFEFNSIGRRLFGEDFKAGRGFKAAADSPPSPALQTGNQADPGRKTELNQTPSQRPDPATSAPHAPLEYQIVDSSARRTVLWEALREKNAFALEARTDGTDPKQTRLLGLAFACAGHPAFYLPLPESPAERATVFQELRPLLESAEIEKIGHDLKFALSLLRWQGIRAEGKLFDTMVAHALIEPDLRHSMDYLSEVYFGYAPISESKTREKTEPGLGVLTEPAGELEGAAAAQRADLALQLKQLLEPLLREKGQEKVFYQIESPLIPVLVDMEFEGIRLDARVLDDFAIHLAREMKESEKIIHRLAGTDFNVNSPRQLGQILFETLKISDAPKKTKTGQYATDEQTLATLAPDHEIIQRLLEYRTAAKLKSTYADALPLAVFPKTGRIHTTFNQVVTTTGRLNSLDPNLQNIPVRTERGQEIRKAFIPRDENFLLFSADYSQIELRIIAALSREPALLEAFQTGVDVHTATAARVYGVFLEMVTPEMRRKAKMVNYGIAYGISAFGLAQRLGIPRKEASAIIDEYFRQFPGVRQFMDTTIAFAREHGYVQTVTGRRRYLRDIRSSNNTVRSAAERNAINAPIQGSAADLIKAAMIQIQAEIKRRELKTRMLLQVHDELVFDLYRPEESVVLPLVEQHMKTALTLDVPMAVELGVGGTWLEAH